MKTSYEVEMRLNIKTPMRDGVELSSDLYLPKARGSYPTVLMRTPYSNNMDMMIEKGRALANNGYACVMQDTRGRWDSDGDHYPFHHDGPDGFDTQEWVGAQEWSNGKIGMSGSSYGGLVQLMSAPHRSRYLTCMAPRVICADFFGGLLYPGGALQLNVAMTWGMRTNGRTAQSIEYHNWTEAFRSLPIYDIDELAGRRLQFWKDWIDHPTYDDYWSAIDVEDKWGEIAAPSFNMGGWFDLYASDTFSNFNGQRKEGRTPESRQSRIIVGPWPHALSQSTKTGDVDFGAQSMVDLDAQEMRWFDHWLKGIDNGIVDEPPVRLFIMGVNQWRDEHEWPLARTDWQKWYLHSGGSANSVRGDGVLSTEQPGDEPTDRFLYDPDYPVQTSRRQQLLLAPHRPLGSLRPTHRGDAGRRALLHGPAVRAGYGGDGADYPDSIRRDGRARHRLDREAGGRLHDRVRHEPLRRYSARQVQGEPDRPHAADAQQGLRVPDRGRRHRQRVQEGPLAAPGGLVVELPQVRPQPQHGQHLRQGR